MAAGRPGFFGSDSTLDSPSACRRTFREPSVEPLSTATMPRRGWVCRDSDRRHSRSHGNPSWTTRTTRTVGSLRPVSGASGSRWVVASWAMCDRWGAGRTDRASLARHSRRTREPPEQREGGSRERAPFPDGVEDAAGPRRPGRPVSRLPLGGRALRGRLLRSGLLGACLLGGGLRPCRRLLRPRLGLRGCPLGGGLRPRRRLLHRGLGPGDGFLRRRPGLRRGLLGGGPRLCSRRLRRGLSGGGHQLTPSRRSGRHPLQASSLPFAHPPPHAVPLVSAEGVVQTLDADRAVRADPLGLPRGAALLGEEHLRVLFPAPSPLLPWNVMVHGPLLPESHSCNSDGRGRRSASRDFRLRSPSCSPLIFPPFPIAVQAPGAKKLIVNLIYHLGQSD